MLHTWLTAGSATSASAVPSAAPTKLHPLHATGCRLASGLGTCSEARIPTRIKSRRAPNELDHVPWSDQSSVAPARIRDTVAFSSRAAAQRARASQHHPGPTSKRQLAASSGCNYVATAVTPAWPACWAQGDMAAALVSLSDDATCSAGGTVAFWVELRCHSTPRPPASDQVRVHTPARAAHLLLPPAAAAAARRSRTHTDVMESRAEPTDVPMLAPSVCSVRRAAPARPRACLAV